MNIYMIYSAKEQIAKNSKLLCGIHSYVAHGNTVMSEKLPSDLCGNIMIISAQNAGEHISPAVYDECRKRKFTSVFLDAEEPCENNIRAFCEISESLSRRGLRVFCPIAFEEFCPQAIPVADTCISGGVLSEYLKSLTVGRKRLALSLPRMCASFPMPPEDSCGNALSPRELSRLRDMHDAEVFFSPAMLLNYFIYSPSPRDAGFVLFDDGHTVTEKLRLAKKLGVSDVFLRYCELSDIADDIWF